MIHEIVEDSLDKIEQRSGEKITKKVPYVAVVMLWYKWKVEM